MQKPVLILDGLNVFIRHFCANPAMSEHGDPMGGFVGFIRSVGNLCDQFDPEKIIVVWESGGNAKRVAISKGAYKGGRRPQSLNRYYGDDIPATESNNAKQISLVVEALKHLPVTQLYVKNTEADDVIGYLCKYKFPKNNVIVVSSDKDLYQLINENVKLWSLNQKKIIDEKEVVEKFGVSPQNWCVARAFIGDASDAIEGVGGAGFKTLTKKFPMLSLNEHVSVSEIVIQAKALSEKSSVKLLRTLVEQEEKAKTNWKLMHLDVSKMSSDQVKAIEFQLGTPQTSMNKIALLRILHREGLRNIDVSTTCASLKTVCA